MKWLAAFLLLTTVALGQTMTSGTVTGTVVRNTTAAQPLTITTTGLPPGVLGASYSQVLSATGGSPTYNWSVNAPVHSVLITWTASAAAGITNYKVYRGTQTGGPYTFIGNSGGALSFTDPNVTNGSSYFYVVSTVAAGVESGNSSEIPATIPATPQPPPGLTISSAGIVSGIPTAVGNYNFSVKVTDQVAGQATASLSIQVTGNTSVADNRYCNTNGTWIGPTTDGVASLPTSCINTALSNTPSPGATITVCPLSAGSCTYTNIQAALSAVSCGQTISIRATTDGTAQGTQLTYDGPFVLPQLTCSAGQWVTVQSSLTNLLPAEGNRIYPCWAGYSNPLFGRPAPSYACPATTGVYMPRLQVLSTCVPPSQTTPSGCSKVATSTVLSTGSNTPSFWRFIGLEVVQKAVVPQIGSTVVDFSNADHLIADRMLIHGGTDPNGQSTENYCKGISLEGKNLALIDSYVFDIHSVWPAGVPNHIGCTDSQAVYLGGTNSNATFGTIKVVNNFLESSSEAFFTGGGAATVVPADFEIRRNHSFRPLFWKTDCTAIRSGCQGYTWFGTQFGIKNGGEFKNNGRTLLEGNIITNVWRGDADQKGTALVVTPKNPNGTCNVCTVNNVVIRYNLIEHSTNGIGIAAVLASQGGTLPASLFNIVVHDNIGDDINGDTWDSNPTGGCCSYGNATSIGSGIAGSVFHDVYIDHNTFQNYATPNVTLSKAPTVGLMTSAVSAPFQPLNIKLTNNIATGGFKGYNPGLGDTPQCAGVTGGSAILLNQCFAATWCMDGNVLSTATNGNTRPNTPYPGTTAYNAGDPTSGSPACSLTLKGNAAPSTPANVGFVNFNGGSGGDYHLCTGVGIPSGCTAASIYLNSANDGRAPGAAIDTVNSNIAGVQ